MQPRLRHGTINFNDQLIIFGGASGYLPTSGTYNDIWQFDFIKKFHRMTTLGPEIPSPRANFGFVRAGVKIFAVGGRSSNFDPFLAHHNPFEVYMLTPKAGSWQRLITTGTEPQHSNGARCVMLTHNELLVVTGLIPTIHNWMQEVVPDGNYEHLRTQMQVSILKFSDNSMERGTWFRVADWHHNRRGMPMPRAEFHLVSMKNDHVLMVGGCSTNQIVQDAWVMKITRQPNYSLKWTPIAIENPFVPSLPLNLFPSCLVRDLLVFTGVRTIMKKPGFEKPKEEPKKPTQDVQASTSQPQFERRSTPIFINLERPLNTIGAMAAFSVSSQPAVPPQKVLKMQISPEPLPEPPRRLQDYPMRIFCLDLSSIISGSDEVIRANPTVRWLDMKNSGLFPSAPELRAHCTFTPFDNKIILVGGVRRSQNEDDRLFTQATNEVYILDYVHDET